MSDFEQCNCNTGEWQGQLCDKCNGTGQAAKQSMQGEAVAWIIGGGSQTLTTNKGDTAIAERFNWPVTNLYTHAPDSAARIAELEAEIARLQKELEEARKVPEGYALVPIEPTQGMLDAVFVNDLDWSDTFAPSENDRRLVYKAMLSAAPDASLNIKGGAE